jgi:glycosyltransferase involved in cell wall biosynthesis
MLKIAAIIPAYNEEKSIADVVNGLNAIDGNNMFSVVPVVINDCSSDNTQQVVDGLNCIAINLPVNLGIGGAVQSGFKYAFDNGYDYAVQVDGDGQHPTQEISRLLQTAIEKNADVVIGSRFIDKQGFQSSAMRRLGINYFKYLNKQLVGVTVSDSTSGFRLINKKVLSLVTEYYPDEYPEPEAIILYALNKYKIVEVPVIMKERQGGISSIGFFSSIYYMFKVSLAIIYTFIRLKFKK